MQSHLLDLSKRVNPEYGHSEQEFLLRALLPVTLLDVIDMTANSLVGHVKKNCPRFLKKLEIM